MHVYGQNIMNEGTVRQSVECSKMDEQMFTMKSEVFGRPSVVSDDLVHSVEQKICERRRFTISELSCEFQQISRNLLYEIMTVRLGYHKFYARWVPKLLTGVHKTQRMASVLTFYSRTTKMTINFSITSYE
jgi:hypothetical protein